MDSGPQSNGARLVTPSAASSASCRHSGGEAAALSMCPAARLTSHPARSHHTRSLPSRSRTDSSSIRMTASGGRLGATPTGISKTAYQRPDGDVRCSRPHRPVHQLGDEARITACSASAASCSRSRAGVPSRSANRAQPPSRRRGTQVRADHEPVVASVDGGAAASRDEDAELERGRKPLRVGDPGRQPLDQVRVEHHLAAPVADRGGEQVTAAGHGPVRAGLRRPVGVAGVLAASWRAEAEPGVEQLEHGNPPAVAVAAVERGPVSGEAFGSAGKGAAGAGRRRHR